MLIQNCNYKFIPLTIIMHRNIQKHPNFLKLDEHKLSLTQFKTICWNGIPAKLRSQAWKVLLVRFKSHFRNTFQLSKAEGQRLLTEDGWNTKVLSNAITATTS